MRGIKNTFMMWGVSVITLSQLTFAQTLREPRPFSLEADRRDGPILVWYEAELKPDIYEGYLKRIAAMGAKHVVLPFFGCQKNKESSQVGDCELYPESLFLQQAALAKKNGFVVTFLPIVLTPNGDWRGDFVPQDVQEWFKSYTKWIVGVALHAKNLGMPELVVASEFKLLFKQTNEWRQVLKEVRLVFPGPLIVAANWDKLDIEFWDESDAIGVSYYFPLSKNSLPTDSDLDNGHLQHQKTLQALAQKFNRPIHITEVGYPSLPTAAAQPWSFPSPLVNIPADKTLQKRCFESFARTWQNTTNLVHTGFWATSNPATLYANFDFEIIDKPAESAISSYLKERKK